MVSDRRSTIGFTCFLLILYDRTVSQYSRSFMILDLQFELLIKTKMQILVGLVVVELY